VTDYAHPKVEQAPHSARWTARIATTLALLAAALGLAACGGDEEPTTTSAAKPPAETGPANTPKPGVGDGQGGVKLTEIGTFEQPLYVTQPPSGDNALYVVEQTGRVQRVPAGGGEPEPFLDLSDEITCCGEQGLLSIAFAPDYERSGLLYASYTNVDGDSRVVEYRRSDSGNAGDPESAREVFATDQPYPNHNGGLVLFGPDDELYLGLGDGGSAGDPERRAQDRSSPLGKLLRLDPSSPENDPEIYALGLRNPWRYSFDRETGDLWIGDVGQNDLEEIDGVSRADAEGANFGWSAFEGTERFNADQEAPNAIEPVLVYGRDGGCSVTGGFVVRDPELRSLYGRYLYGDYCAGELRSFTARPGAEATDDTALGQRVPGLSSFGEDAAGHIYATSLEGPVYRLDPAR
jgi:glucose/arabinose dehydrogenase